MNVGELIELLQTFDPELNPRKLNTTELKADVAKRLQ